MRDFLGAVVAAAAASNKICRKETLGTLLVRFGTYVVLQFKGMLFFLWQVIFFEPVFLLEVFMLSAEADKKAGAGRLLLLCMPFRSAAHAAIGLFVFAFDAPKFFGALDAGSTSRACVRKVGCRQRRPKNSILHAKLFPTHASVVDLSGSN